MGERSRHGRVKPVQVGWAESVATGIWLPGPQDFVNAVARGCNTQGGMVRHRTETRCPTSRANFPTGPSQPSRSRQSLRTTKVKVLCADKHPHCVYTYTLLSIAACRAHCLLPWQMTRHQFYIHGTSDCSQTDTTQSYPCTQYLQDTVSHIFFNGLCPALFYRIL